MKKMSNVENITDEEEEYFDPDLNPLERFKFSDEELVEYLKSNIIKGVKKDKDIRDYQRDKNKPIRTEFKTIAFAYKDGGKTNFINTIAELDERHGDAKTKTGVKYDPLLSHVKHLLEEKLLKRGNPLETLDAEGKGDVLSYKFDNLMIRYRSMFYPDGPMPTMQNPVEFVKEMILFFKACTWAHNHKELYREMTKDEKIPKGLEAPNASAFENYSVLTDQFMNYLGTVPHEEDMKKLIQKGQELGAPLGKHYDTWYIRNCNWDFIGGYQLNESPLHYVATARAKKIWGKEGPTDNDDLDLYNKATHAFNIIVFLWYEKDPETEEIEFWGQIVSSDFMNPGLVLKPIKNPTYAKVLGEIVKFSHARFLDAAGKWKKFRKGDEIVEIWIKNKAKDDIEEEVKEANEKPKTKTKKTKPKEEKTKEVTKENEDSG